jgi:ABC-2 type transport system ATP-binding protein
VQAREEVAVVADALVVEELRKSYGSTVAVAGLSLRVASGEIFGILGPNGSGKTTTVECAYGLRKPDAGRIRVLGIDPQAEPDRVARLVGVQLQASALPERIKVSEALQLFAALARQPVNERDALDRWGLAAKRNATFGSLSGGQRQRLFVALALLARPRLVFLDEMTTGLDPAARHEVWQLVEQVRADGAAVVLVTHFMDEAERLCDRVAVIAAGKVLAEDTPAGLVARYGGATTVSFGAVHEVDELALAGLPGLLTLTRHADRIELQGKGAFLTALGHVLTLCGLGEVELRVQSAGLEDAYMRLLGQHDGQVTAPVSGRVGAALRLPTGTSQSPSR